MLNVFRRHKHPCKRDEWDFGYTKCSCPVIIRGTLNGRRITSTLSKYLPREQQSSLEAGRALALLWERAGHPVKPTEESAASPATDTEKPASLPSVEIAVKSFISHATDTGNGESTLYKKNNVFLTGKQSLTAFAAHKGVRFLQEIDISFLREWRSTWKVAALSRHKRQCQVIGFLWFCERSGWFPRNFASDMTKSLGRIKFTPTQTGYFSPELYKAIIDATYLYSDRPSIDKHNSLQIGGDRIRTLTELMRWTGLRIRDAATLERNKLSFDPATGMHSIMVYQKKTGEPVYCPIPPHVVEMLRSIPRGPKQSADSRYFFWTGNGKPKTVVANWQRSYDKLFDLVSDLAGKPAHPHMFRDTFAVESILAGMRIEDVSMILGHSSVATTEKSYMPWVRARQESLNTSVVKSWINQGIIRKTGLQSVAKRAS